MMSIVYKINMLIKQEENGGEGERWWGNIKQNKQKLTPKTRWEYLVPIFCVLLLLFVHTHQFSSVARSCPTPEEKQNGKVVLLFLGVIFHQMWQNSIHLQFMDQKMKEAMKLFTLYLNMSCSKDKNLICK